VLPIVGKTDLYPTFYQLIILQDGQVNYSPYITKQVKNYFNSIRIVQNQYENPLPHHYTHASATIPKENATMGTFLTSDVGPAQRATDHQQIDGLLQNSPYLYVLNERMRKL
jgi:hypothetical protein